MEAVRKHQRFRGAVLVAGKQGEGAALVGSECHLSGFQFGRDPLDGADPDAKIGSDLSHSAVALRQCRTDSGFRGGVDLWSA
jgi:hypothetical protein